MRKIIKLSALDGDSVSEYKRTALEESLSAEDDVRVDPAAVLERARAEAETKVQEAYAEGLRRGMEAGEKKFRESVDGSEQLLNQAADRLEQARQEFLDEMEPQLVKLATSIASKIIEGESRVSTDLIKRTTRNLLEKIMDEETVVLRANSKDLETLRDYRVELLETFEGIRRIELVADDTIEPGGCVAQTETLCVDGRLQSQLEKILNELLD